ncbi:hypothetical protein F5Y14DRAFT_114987 [Nemania sp. NC0429]|nr:hypothetical protein F5Y14DRAFT_114987 [Nemania sp. NC0429]
MYSKMNSLAIVGLFAAGVLGASAGSLATAATASSSSAATVTAAASSKIAAPAVTAVSAVSAIANNGTWAYWNTTVTAVEVVNELTTKCNEATTLTFNDCEYPATKGEVIVVTNCPCTVTKVHPTLTSSLCPPGVTWPAQHPPPETEVAPAPSTTPHMPGWPSTPSYPTKSPVQVGGVAPTGSGNAIGLIVVAVVAAALGL